MNRLVPLNTNNIKKSEVDSLLYTIADYVHNYKILSPQAISAAKLCLLDSIACAILALDDKNCTKLLGPVIPGTEISNGSRVLGTEFILDPIKATFDIGACIRWLDYNDTWLAQEWGHPSDNISGILAVSDFISKHQGKTIPLELILESIVKSYEIQGILALENSFNRVGLDHVVLVKIASIAVISRLLGGGRDQTIQALANAWLDGQSLRVYRHGANTAQRKSWAAADAASRAVRLAWLSVFNGEPACATPISAKIWGVQDVFMHGKELVLAKELGTYVIENILFKVSYPAEFHGQTAVEAAIQLHKEIKNKDLDDIDKIIINTQESGNRIINKSGPLNNYADRDHCLQYMVAVGLLEGNLEAHHYSDDYASNNTRLYFLIEKMQVTEDVRYSKDYLDLSKRAIPNSIQIFFKDGSSTEKKEIYYPLGHKNRRDESLPYLKEKYVKALMGRFENEKLEILLNLWDMSIDDFSDINVCDFIEFF